MTRHDRNASAPGSFSKDGPKVNLIKLRTAYDQILSGRGPDGASLFFRDFYERLRDDVMIGFFFDGKDLEHIATQQQAFVERAAGLRASYGGKPPATAHLGLPPILPGFFDRRLVILRETLSDYGVTGDLQDAWIEFENAFREAIVK